MYFLTTGNVFHTSYLTRHILSHPILSYPILSYPVVPSPTLISFLLDIACIFLTINAHFSPSSSISCLLVLTAHRESIRERPGSQYLQSEEKQEDNEGGGRENEREVRTEKHRDDDHTTNEVKEVGSDIGRIRCDKVEAQHDIAEIGIQRDSKTWTIGNGGQSNARVENSDWDRDRASVSPR